MTTKQGGKKEGMGQGGGGREKEREYNPVTNWLTKKNKKNYQVSKYINNEIK